ncbi:uncharacterized protein LOC115034807, partial [Acyrthosiphon pisum]|uniref:Uncharacterized protein n=1 Tax=Acyrthosiphon pisum TaxID=7029 RepID=A0A8R2JV14_ACYPI
MISSERDNAISAAGDNAVSTAGDNVMEDFLNNVDDDDDYAQVADVFEDLGFCKKEDSYTTLDNGKRVSSANTKSAVRAKKIRLNFVKSSGFTLLSTSSNNTISWYYVKNTNNIQNYIYFLDSINPTIIYADFEAILKKTDEKIGEKTSVFQKHEPMSYGFMVKANEEIPVELLEKFGIPTSPVIYRGNENNK